MNVFFTSRTLRTEFNVKFHRNSLSKCIWYNVLFDCRAFSSLSDVCVSPLILFRFPLVNILCGGMTKMLLCGITLILKCVCFERVAKEFSTELFRKLRLHVGYCWKLRSSLLVTSQWLYIGIPWRNSKICDNRLTYFVVKNSKNLFMGRPEISSRYSTKFSALQEAWELKPACRRIRMFAMGKYWIT